MTGKSIVLTIPEATPTLNVWQRMHFRAKKRLMERYRMLVRMAIGKRWGEPPIERCVVRIERHHDRMPDWDGLYGGVKGLLDVLVVQSTRHPLGLGIIRDDSPKVIVELVVRHIKSKQCDRKTVVSIFPLAKGADA